MTGSLCPFGPQHRWKAVWITATNALHYPKAHIVRKRWCDCGAKWTSVKPL